MSAQQLFLFDQAQKGKKPKILKAHGGLEAIVTAVKWAAGLVGKKFPPEWEKAMKTFLDGVKNDQAQEIKQGKRFKNDKSHLPADWSEAIVTAMCLHTSTASWNPRPH